MPHVTVVLQSEAILKDPSSYWISVINAGRHFTLDAVMGANIGLGAGMRDAEGVGKVIGRLMLVADVLAVNPRSLALDAAVAAPAAETAGEDVAAGVGGLTLEGDAGGGAASALAPPPRSVEAHLVQQFYATQLSHPGLAAVLPPPRIAHATGGPTLALQPPRESAGHRLESDEYFLADDPKVHGKSKMKKAFCEPGNVGFCPPIELLAYFGGLSDSDGGSGGCYERAGRRRRRGHRVPLARQWRYRDLHEQGGPPGRLCVGGSPPRGFEGCCCHHDGGGVDRDERGEERGRRGDQGCQGVEGI